ncbi:cell envelope integrity protein TolA [Candidatus Gracilibacteria bacterium 28_42_T64]|nr:cell envelope integrity protein TolA [Candidatus Gracilibacteria bacterium 28_42_T64]
MKLKKSLVKVIAIGSIFFVSTLSFGGVISLQDSDLDNFWSVKKLNISLIDASYAESGGKESGWSYEKESGGDYHKTYTHPNTAVSDNNPVLEVKKTIEKKKVILSESEKTILRDKLDTFSHNINNKYSADTRKLSIYKRLNELIDEKIFSLESNITSTDEENMIYKYEKKKLLFSELNILIQEKILVYIDAINLSLEKKAAQIARNEAIIKENANNEALAEADERARLAKIEADKKIALTKEREETKRKIEQGKIEREKRLAAEKEAERLAKIETDRLNAIATEQARIAAQKAAQEKADTTTSAS